MKACIDIGNTLVKIYAVDQGVVSDGLVLPEWQKKEISFFLESNSVEELIICNVRYEEIEIKKLSLELNIPCLILAHDISLPIKLKYKNPETLGRDRIAVVAGAAFQYPNQVSLIIDLGTCITYDLIDGERNYLGGSIHPGLYMRLRAMNHFTGRLPLVEVNENVAPLGDDTISCLQSGAFWGVVYEIRGAIEELTQRYTQVNIILTGGDASKFEKYIKNGIFADSSLLIKGLNYILDHNEEKYS